MSKTRKLEFGTSRQLLWRNKQERNGKLKPQLLCAVLLLFPLVSCASSAIPFPGPLSSSAVLDANFSERIREIKKDKLRLSQERETHARLEYSHSNEFKKSLDTDRGHAQRNCFHFN